MNDTKRLEKLKKVGFQTGSVRFGCDNHQDEDWVIKNKHWEKIIGTQLGHFYYQSHDYDDGEFRCFWLNHGDIKYNFIIPNEDSDYREMKLATKLMTKIPVRYIQDKAKRVRLFESFRELVRKDQIIFSRNYEFDAEDIRF